MSEEVKEAIRLCNNVIENADYMECKYMKEYKKSSIDILVKEIERLKEEKESWKRVATKNFNEAEDYKYIIKEVREYIEENRDRKTGRLDSRLKRVLEILDKGE